MADRHENKESTADVGSDKHSLRLRVVPDPVLRGACEAVERFDKDLRRLVKRMTSLMRTENGIGLAGPQIGVPRRLFTAEVGDDFLFLANPRITNVSGEKEETVEGCLSLPQTEISVARPTEITLTGYDEKGRKKTLELHGLWARVAQHEIDHLDGILICDRGVPVPPGGSSSQQ